MICAVENKHCSEFPWSFFQKNMVLFICTSCCALFAMTVMMVRYDCSMQIWRYDANSKMDTASDSKFVALYNLARYGVDQPKHNHFNATVF
mmetsp:Transcript_19066/g.44115  ORF Transcript_19066/g.44115 Transcript_19066/m.44115 type:complete len:91 (+) Transcript_19066:2044-2316(+)